jgi:hypothetical protein
MQTNINKEAPNSNTMVLQHNDCGCDWLLTNMEQTAIYRKGLEMPKRYPECRQARRQQATNSEVSDLK